MVNLKEMEEFSEEPRFPFYLLPVIWDKEYKIPKVGKDFSENLKTHLGYNLKIAFLKKFYSLNKEKLPADFTVKTGHEINEMFDNLLYTHNLTI